jgi:hypothetical protein
MATIRVKRSTLSSAPTGLTFGEPAFVDGINSFYVTKNNGTSLRVGAEVDSSTSLGTSDNKIPTQNAVKTYVDSNVAAGAVASINGLTGTVSLTAGTGIGLASIIGKTIQITNAGVQSLTGTSNQITVSGSTGAVTLSLPNDVTINNNLTVTGNLTINGSTTTVNSNTMTVDDPLIIIGTSGGVPIAASDGAKDRGIVFNYFDSTGKTGFFGWDASGSRFVFSGSASVANDVVSSFTTYSPVQASNFILTESIAQNTVTIAPTSGASNTPTYTLPDYSYGTFLIPSNEGTANYIIKSNGSSSQPTWINSNAAGFTAFTSTNVLTASDTSDAETFIAFVPLASAANQGIRYNSGLTYNAVTNSVSATTFVGAFSGNATTASTLQTSRSIGLTGDISGSASFNGSADINITATIAANSVALGTDTTGNYVATLSTSSTGLSIANSGAESAAVTVNFATITSGLNMGTFSFATGEFSNSSGTVSLGTIDGGTFT